MTSLTSMIKITVLAILIVVLSLKLCSKKEKIMLEYNINDKIVFSNQITRSFTEGSSITGLRKTLTKIGFIESKSREYGEFYFIYSKNDISNYKVSVYAECDHDGNIKRISVH